MADLIGKTALATGALAGNRTGDRPAARRRRPVAVHYANSEAARHPDGGGDPGRRRPGVPGTGRARRGRRRGHTLFAGLEAGLSGQRLDILVNNAATRVPHASSRPPEQFDRMFAVNVRAPLFIVQRALPLLRDGGRIINISSSDTRVALPLELAYAMTKGAVNVIGQALANALGARGITVNAVAPGPTDTDMTAFLRGTPSPRCPRDRARPDRPASRHRRRRRVPRLRRRAGSPVNSWTSPAACGLGPAWRGSLTCSPYPKRLTSPHQTALTPSSEARDVRRRRPERVDIGARRCGCARGQIPACPSHCCTATGRTRAAWHRVVPLLAGEHTVACPTCPTAWETVV